MQQLAQQTIRCLMRYFNKEPKSQPHALGIRGEQRGSSKSARYI